MPARLVREGDPLTARLPVATQDTSTGKPGGACLMLVLGVGKPSWRSPDVRGHRGG